MMNPKELATAIRATYELAGSLDLSLDGLNAEIAALIALRDTLHPQDREPKHRARRQRRKLKPSPPPEPEPAQAPTMDDDTRAAAKRVAQDRVAAFAGSLRQYDRRPGEGDVDVESEE